MEATPQHIKVEDVCRGLRQIEGVRSVNNLHIWAVAPKKLLMTAHCEVEDGANRSAIQAAIGRLTEELDIKHSTVQLSEPVQSGHEARSGSVFV